MVTMDHIRLGCRPRSSSFLSWKKVCHLFSEFQELDILDLTTEEKAEI